MRCGIALSGALMICLENLSRFGRLLDFVVGVFGRRLAGSDGCGTEQQAKRQDLCTTFFILTRLRGPEVQDSVPEQIGVFLLLRVVDELHVLVGNLLDFVQPPPLIVLRDQGILEQLLQSIVRVTPDAAHGIASFFGELVDVA